ncbi:tyrosine-protein phosphatase [Paenibacillus spongiae]|uniref:Tyrosine-protein phosphatase n=1 Tax=Paenibacillus spongiae TaxID=2909671 RepID=A0ABY5S7X4_9BACL|nr:CpsB/CapC family capsule biosynthesis tyrosine phosphatase [Paenibacillus spongiae]UVI28932.1 tyrosine protein phosphatase [Paenibacillus spongiae]
MLTDIHCHILDGVDDGAKDLQESLEMARIALRHGTHHIVATPHFFEKCIIPRDHLLEKVNLLQQELDRQGIAVRISAGNEVRLESARFIEEHLQKESFCYLNEAGSFILLEQRWDGYCPDTEEVVDWFLKQGTTPIIPHPERHFFFREDPELLSRLIAQGAWTQVSVDSLLGTNGKEAEIFGRQLVERNEVHTLASDAHNVVRKPNLSEGIRLVSEWAGPARVQEIIDRIDRVAV